MPGAAESATVTPDSRPGNGAAPAPSESGKGSVGTKPSTSPKPSGTAKPPASALDYWPSEANTGVPKGTALKPSGSITVTKSGTVIEGLEVTGCITIKTSNVTIRKTKINAVGCGVKTDLEGTYKNVLVEDVEIDGKGDLKLWLIGWTGFTCRRCYLHGGFSGAHPRSNTVIEDSYIITTSPGGSSEGRHLSGIGFHGGKGMVIRHNRVECPVDGCSAALSLYGNFELVEDVLVEDNYFHGGSYCTYAGSVQSKPFPYAKNVRYLNNAFSKMGVEPFPKCGRHGPVTSYEHGNGNEWTGNYWFDEKKTPITIK
ncbi:right-handed parallel beta-helix repeat-containing protein [Longispora albida]|uniref:right-handed parallel beta-helix repeat-containing protein n=1 Tax=Longispora albida TaxID=203523 RepID=UPI000365B801|nr:right-handed parallel beta-helix repeat-containing protein [Longispora albida]